MVDDMRICIYAICKNEIDKIKDWLLMVQESDCVVVLDTGSTDGTWEFLQSQDNIICEQKIIEPFRFDVARNEALKLVPEDCDICVPMDIDQQICKGFFDQLKGQWIKDIGILRIPQYFKTNHKSGYWIAHSRTDGQWYYPIYEVYKSTKETRQACSPLIIHEWNITKTSHDSYLELAELSIQENPKDPYPRWAYKHIIKERESLFDST